MSAITIDLLNQLRESGMRDETARRIAQFFDQRVEEALREAKAHSDRNRAESEEKTKAQLETIKAREAQFVSAADYHARDKTLATREDIANTHAKIDNVRVEIGELRKENHAEMAEIRKDIRNLYRLFFVAVIGGFGGLAALIVKLYFGA